MKDIFVHSRKGMFDMNNDISEMRARQIMIVILMLAAVLRLWAIWHGYPYSYWGAEIHFVKRAISFGSGDLNPHWFHKPAFLMYILFFEYGLLYLFGKLAGMWSSVNDFAVSYLRNPGAFYLIGRITVSIFSIGTIFMSYSISKVLFNRKVGIFSALILTLSFGHVMLAKDIKADTACAFFTIVSIYYLIMYLKQNRNRHLYVSALIAGVGAATKYYSSFLLVPIFLSVMSSWDRFKFKILFDKVKILSICYVTFYAAFFICSPYIFIDPLGRETTFSPYFKIKAKIDGSVDRNSNNKTMNISLNTIENESKAKVPNNKLTTIVWQYINQLIEGFGWIYFSLIVIGLFYLLIRPLDRTLLFFMLIPLIYITASIILHPYNISIRHQIVIYPLLAILAGVSFSFILGKAPSFYKVGYLLIVLLFIPAYVVILHNIFLSKEDTRNLAKAWIEENIPSGTKILTDMEQLNISPRKEYYENLIKKMQGNGKSQFTAHTNRYYDLKIRSLSDKTYNIEYIRRPWWQKKEAESGIYYATSERDLDFGNPLKPVGVLPYGIYKKNKFEYVVTSSNKYSGFLEKSDKAEKFPSFEAFYHELFKKGKLVKEFNPYWELKKFNPAADGRTSPTVKIFRIN